jgi:hypothetical protein
MTYSLGRGSLWIPAQAGIYLSASPMSPEWVPASAGTFAGARRA